MNPSNCPLCRKSFAADRVKKLHVDRFTGHAVVDEDEGSLLHRVATSFEENTPEEAVNSLMEETRAWLATRPDTLTSVSTIPFRPIEWYRHKVLQPEDHPW